MRRFRWLFVWLIQIAAMAVLGALAALSLWASRALYGICIWGLMPLAGCVSAYIATKKGLLNYAAWIAPPVCLALAHLGVWTYLPGAGPVLLCAFISLVGAAAGEVRLRAETNDT